MKHILIYTCLITSLANIAQGQKITQSSPAASALASALTQLHAGATTEADVDHIRWRDQRYVRPLETLIRAYPATDEAREATLWLATVQIENAQTNTGRALIRDKAKEVRQRLDELINAAPESWQAKMARIKKCGTLMLEGDRQGLEAQVKSILKDIHIYTREHSPRYLEMLAFERVPPSDIEPELRMMLLIASCHAGELDVALRRAEFLKERFPAWSKKARIANVISQLTQGKSPYKPL